MIPPSSDADRRQFLTTSAAAMGAFALDPRAGLLGPLPYGRAPLGVGLIGAGKQGRAILAELQKMEQAAVVAVCDTSEARVRSGLRRARGAQGFADAEQLLGHDGVEAVIVATPTHQHRAVAVAALQAGKHVYCEAPLAATIEDAVAIAEAARASKTTFQTGLLARSNPIYQLARSFYRAGALRELISLSAEAHEKTTWTVPSSDPERARELNWRLDAAHSTGLAGEVGSHQFDAFHWFVGSYPVAVHGHGAVRLHKDGREVADTATCSLQFADGVQLTWDASLCNSYGGTFETYRGSMAAFRLAWNAGWMFKEADAPTQGWEVYANREAFHNDEGITLIADATKLAKAGKLKEGVGLPNPPLYYGLADFVRSVTEQQEVVCSVEEGVRAAVIGILANRAVVTGDHVEIPPELLELR